MTDTNKFKRKFLVSAAFLGGEAIQAEIYAQNETGAKKLFYQLHEVQSRIDAGREILQYSIVELGEEDDAERFQVREDDDDIVVLDTFRMVECRFMKGAFSTTNKVVQLNGGFTSAFGDEKAVFERFVREAMPQYYGAV